MLVMAIVSMALGVASSAYSEIIQAVGSNVRSECNDIVNKLKTMMSKDQTLKEQLTEAYNNRNSELVQSLAYSKGFGPRFQSLKKSIDANKANFKSESEKIQKHYDTAANLADTTSNKSAYAGSSIGSTKSAADQASYARAGYKILADQQNNLSGEQALINGGVTSEKGQTNTNV